MTGDGDRNPGVLVTRPAGQSEALCSAIRARGGRVFEFPVLDIVPRDAADIAHAVAALPPVDIAILVSPNAVAGIPASLDLGTARIAAIGPSTRAALEDAGHVVDIFPESRFDSEHLLRHPALQDVAGSEILIIRGTDGRELLADELTRRGAHVAYLPVYERVAASPDAKTLDALERAWRDGRIDTVIVMSVDSLASLLAILPACCLPLLRQSALVTPSTRVIQTVEDLLPGTRAILADAPHTAAMVATLFANHEESI